MAICLNWTCTNEVTSKRADYCSNKCRVRAKRRLCMAHKAALASYRAQEGE